MAAVISGSPAVDAENKPGLLGILRQLSTPLKANWQRMALTLALLLVTFVVFGLQPPVINNKMNALESVFVEKITNYSNPWYRAINAPYFAVAKLVNIATKNPLQAGRLASAFFAVLALILFFMLMRRWFNYRMAIVGSLLLLINSALVNVAHQAMPLSVMLFFTMAIFVSLYWFITTSKYLFLSLLTYSAVLAISLYIPYMAFIAIISVGYLVIYSRKKLKKVRFWQFSLVALVYGLLLAPLLVSLLGTPGQLGELLGIPFNIVNAKTYLLNLGSLLASLAFFAKTQPILYVGNLPLLDIFTAAMACLGVFYFIRRRRHKRSILIFTSVVILILIIPLGPNYQFYSVALLPLLYIFALAGLVELLKRWLTVFPRNPAARNAGVILVVLAIGITAFFQLSRYYVAWANSPDTKAVYMIEYKEVK
jgi:hypothetical protein